MNKHIFGLGFGAILSIMFATVAVPTFAGACQGDCAPGLADKGNPNGNPDPHGTATGPGKGDQRGRSPVDDKG